MVSKLEASRQQKELARAERRAPLKSMRKALRGHAAVREHGSKPSAGQVWSLSVARVAATLNSSQILNRQ